MGLETKLIIDNKEFLLIDLKVEIARHHNRHRPDTRPRCEEIVMTLEADDAAMLYKWFIDQDEKNGTVTTDLGTENLRTLKLSYAKCYFISESYDIDTDSRHVLKLGIMSRVTVEDIVF